MSNDSIILQLSKIDLQNNIGPISNNCLFALFGPQPAVGSFLDFGSIELLNKDINQIIIQITWSGLPSNFSNYYEGYGLRINNTSFKVNLSLFDNGNFHLLHEYPFSLFEEDRKDNSLLPISTFCLQVNKKLLFTELPNNLSKYSFRMVLIEPEEAFGHRIFPVIFPKIIMHNSKWWNSIWNRSLTVPSLPYVPVVEKINVSLT
jgi:hypothetical protein